MKRIRIFTFAWALGLILAAPVLFAGDDGKQLGSQVLTPTTSTALTIPTGSEWIVFSVRTAGVHVRFTGDAATTSDLYLPAGVYRTDFTPRRVSYVVLSNVRMINSSDGAATVYVAYFKRP